MPLNEKQLNNAILEASERTEENLTILTEVVNEKVNFEVNVPTISKSLQDNLCDLNELNDYGEQLELIGIYLKKIAKSETTKRTALKRLKQKQTITSIIEKRPKKSFKEDKHLHMKMLLPKK